MLSVAVSALHASSAVRVSGEVEPALRSTDAMPYAEAMRPHFELMARLHHVARDAGITYPRYSIAVRTERFCSNATTARLHLTAMVRYDMSSPGGAPPYTAAAEDHVFRFVRHGDAWRVAEHHEITLAELHDPEAMKRLRGRCDPERVIVDERLRSSDRTWAAQQRRL